MQGMEDKEPVVKRPTNTATTERTAAITRLNTANSAVEGEVQQHISSVSQPALSRRRRMMMDAIETCLFPPGVTMEPLSPSQRVIGGFFLWLSQPDGLTGRQLTFRAKEEEDVVLANGGRFQVWGDESTARLNREIRVCFAWEDEELVV
jgi:DNA-binding transcriptional MocR family regulator